MKDNFVSIFRRWYGWNKPSAARL